MGKTIGLFVLMTLFVTNAMADFQASVRLSDFQRLVSRTLLWNESAKAFVLAENEKLLGGGFGGTFFTLGTIRLSGLLREIDNPMGFNAASGVFQEKTKVSLAPSFQSNPRTGLAVSLFDENLTLYVLQKENENSQAGVFCRFSPVPGISQEVLLCLAISPEDPETDWFYEGWPEVSGAIGMAAHRISFQGRGWKVVADIALSAPENAPVGWFGALSGNISLPGTELHSLLCIKSHDFTAVSGVIQEDAFAIDLDGESALLSFLVLKLGYRKSVPQYTAVESAFYAGEESLTVVLGIYPPDTLISHPVLKLEYSGEKAGGPLVFSRDRENCLVSVTLFAFDWMFLNVSAKIVRDASGLSGSLDSSWEFRAAMLRGNISYAVEINGRGILHSCAATLRLDAGVWSFFAKMETRKPVPIEDMLDPGSRSSARETLVWSFGADFTM